MRASLLLETTLLAAMAATVQSIPSVVWGRGAFDVPASGGPLLLLDNGITANFQPGDTHFVIRKGKDPVWYTGITTPQGCVGHRCRLVFQPDGNLVIYYDGVAIWNTGTWGRGVWLAFFDMEPYAVIYDAANNPIWHTPITPPSQPPKAKAKQGYNPCTDGGYDCSSGVPTYAPPSGISFSYPF